MPKIIILLVTLVATPVAVLAATGVSDSTSPKSVTLVPYDGNNEARSAYNFRYLSQNENVTSNRWDILFKDGTELDTIMVVDEVGQLVDLGNISCAAVPNLYQVSRSYTYPGVGHGGYPFAQDRKLNPMFWLEYSNAFTLLQDGHGKPNLNVEQGHCYLLYKVYDDGRDVALFHIKSLVPNKSVTINQIEVFDRSTIQSAAR